MTLRVILGESASSTGGMLGMTRSPVSPRTVWALSFLVIVQATHAPTNVRSTNFMTASGMKVVAVEESRVMIA